MRSPDRSRMSALAALLAQLKDSARHIGYEEAEHDCARLAAALQSVLDEDQLKRATFVGIPRGGLVVLGMLAYPLGLRAEQFADDADEGPLVIVDDCALTGRRLYEALRRTSCPEVVVAHLYSHPNLRTEVMAAEPRVRHAVSAHDLEDLSVRHFSNDEDRVAWRARWRDRLGDDRYWVGQPQAVSFPWTEPDHPFWNAADERIESGWMLQPAHRCLGNRARLGLFGEPPDTSAAWRLCASAAYGLFDGALWLCNTETDRVYSLEGASLEVLRAALSGRDVDERPEESARLIHDLESSGLIERIDGHAS